MILFSFFFQCLSLFELFNFWKFSIFITFVIFMINPFLHFLVLFLTSNRIDASLKVSNIHLFSPVNIYLTSMILFLTTFKSIFADLWIRIPNTFYLIHQQWITQIFHTQLIGLFLPLLITNFIYLFIETELVILALSFASTFSILFFIIFLRYQIFNNLWVITISLLYKFFELPCVITFGKYCFSHWWLQHFGNKCRICFLIGIKKLSNTDEIGLWVWF
jgi:hypothetical protein